MSVSDERRQRNQRDQEYAERYYGEQITPQFPIPWKTTNAWRSGYGVGMVPECHSLSTETLLFFVNQLVAHINELHHQIADLRYELSGEDE